MSTLSGLINFSENLFRDFKRSPRCRDSTIDSQVQKGFLDVIQFKAGVPGGFQM
jgi:hypothetical protein